MPSPMYQLWKNAGVNFTPPPAETTPTQPTAAQLLAAATAAGTDQKRALDRRDELIVEARNAGATLKTIATALGLTEAGVLKICRRARQ